MKNKNKKDPIELVRKNIRNLAPYSTARDEYGGDIGIYLDANESPYNNDYNRYPDPHQKLLKERISEIKSIPMSNIFIGNGSDEAIDLAFRIFCDPRKDNAVSISPTYGMYKVAAATNDIELREVRLNSDFSLNVEALLAAADSNTKLMFLCSPNNPTGNIFPTEEIEKLITGFDGMVVLDEAYIDFAQDESFIGRLGEFSNLIILQTLSKARGMAGLRLGMAFAREDIINIFSRVKYPYNINVITQKIVLQELSKDVGAQIAEIKRQRERIVTELAGYNVIKHVYPTAANFVLVKVDDPKGVYNTLIDSGIIVRDRSRIKGCEGCLRLSIGTPTENDRLLEVLSVL